MPQPSTSSPDRDRLSRALRALEGGSALVGSRVKREVTTGWSSVDREVGLARGALHEWCGVDSAEDGHWTPPLLVLAHLARCGLSQRLSEPSARSVKVLWIGRSVWPYPRALMNDVTLAEEGDATPGTELDRKALETPGLSNARKLELDASRRTVPLAQSSGAANRRLDVGLAPVPQGTEPRGELFERSLFLDPRDASSRLWAIDSALRCKSVAVVVADVTRFEMAASRRLQLAAEAGGALALVARPRREARTISAATTRWIVERALVREDWPRWTLEVVRCKGTRNRSTQEASRASRSLGQSA